MASGQHSTALAVQLGVSAAVGRKGSVYGTGGRPVWVSGAYDEFAVLGQDLRRKEGSGDSKVDELARLRA